jgi:TM2 domain-containing membrane protein YozV
MAENFCPQCGKTYPFESEMCPNCGYRVPVIPIYSVKRPWIAALLSFLFFGAGQVYNGQIRKGIAFLILTLLGTLVFLLPGVLVWIYGIYEAALTSQRMNAGVIPGIPTHAGHLALFVVVVLFIYVGVGVAVAGFAASLFPGQT